MAAKTEIGELQVLITAQADKFNAEIAKVQGQVDSMSKAFNKSTSGISAKAVAMGGVLSTAFTKVFQVIAQHVGDAVTRLDTLNNFPKVMSNLGIGAEDAQKSINKLSDKLQGLPTNLSDAAMAVQRFTSANGNIAASTDMFLALNDAILAVGAPTEIQKSTLEQLSQAYAKNRPDMMEWRTMMSAMPAQLKQVASAMGYVSSSDLGEALRTGAVSMDDFMATVMRLDREGVAGFKSFSEQARNATGGVQTSITNLKISIQRGLADIMNAIGQTNISGFFNKVASVISKVSTYIAAFVKLVKEAIAWIGSLFGKSGSTSGLVKETGSASGNLSSGAASAGEMADNLGSAGKEAKKLKGQLAGFDEMNVLTEQDASSGSSGSGSGSSGGSGGGGGGFADYEWEGGIDAAGDKVQELAEKMKAWFQDAFNFDWDTIGSAIVQFWDDLKAAAEPVVGVVKDIWNEYIKPLVTWTGNVALPAALNAIGGAINFVGTVIGEAWNTFLKPFVDAFLVPIAKWTGGVIVQVLNDMGNGLRALAQNKDAMTVIAGGITALGVALVGAKIYEKFSNATSAIRAFMKGAATFETLENVIGTPLAKVVSAFDKFKGAFDKANSAISNFLKKGVNKLTSGFKSLVNAVKDPQKAIGDLKTKVGEFTDTLHSKFGPGIENFRKGLSDVGDGFQKIVTHGGTTTNWLKGTALSAFDGFKNVLGGVKNTLSNLWQTFLNNPLGIITGLFSALMATNEQFRTQMMDLLQSVITPLANVMSSLMTLLQPIADILVQLIEMAVQPLITLLQPLAPILETILNVCLTPLATVLQAIGDVINTVVKPALDAISGAFEWLGNLLGINTQKTNENKDAHVSEASQLGTNTNAVTGYNSELDKNIEKKKTLKDLTEEVRQAESNLVNAFEATRNAQANLEEIAKKHNMTVDQAKAYVDNLDLASGNLSDEDIELAKAVFGLYDAQDRENESLEELNKTTEERKQKMQDNKNEVIDSLAVEKKAQLAAQLSKGDYEGVAKSLQELSAATGDYTTKNGEHVELTSGDMEALAQHVAGSLASIDDENGRTWSSIWEAAQYSTNKLKDETVVNLINSAKDAASGSQEVGTNFVDGLVIGANNNLWKAYNAGWDTGNRFKQGAKDATGTFSPSRDMMEIGGFLTEGLAIGVNDGTAGVVKSAKILADRTKEAFQNNAELSVDMVDNLRNLNPADMLSAVTGPKLSGMVQEQLELIGDDKQPIQIGLKIDGEDIPISATRIADTLNNASFLTGRSVVNI